MSYVPCTRTAIKRSIIPFSGTVLPKANPGRVSFGYFIFPFPTEHMIPALKPWASKKQRKKINTSTNVLTCTLHRGTQIAVRVPITKVSRSVSPQDFLNFVPGVQRAAPSSSNKERDEKRLLSKGLFAGLVSYLADCQAYPSVLCPALLLLYQPTNEQRSISLCASVAL